MSENDEIRLPLKLWNDPFNLPVPAGEEEMHLPRNDLPVVPGAEVAEPSREVGFLDDEPEIHDAEIVEDADGEENDVIDGEAEVLETNAVASAGLYRLLRQASLSLRAPEEEKPEGKDQRLAGGGGGFAMPSFRMPFREKVAQNRASHLEKAAKHLQQFDHLVTQGPKPGQSFSEYQESLKEVAGSFLDHLEKGTDESALRELSRKKVDSAFLHNLQEGVQHWKNENETFLQKTGLTEKMDSIREQVTNFIKALVSKFSGPAASA